MARPSKKEQAKQELAARLGVPVEDILTRSEVAPMLNPPTTPDGMIKNLDASPPYITKGERHLALYPRAWVDEHLKHGKVMHNGQRLLGAQPWPPQPPPSPPTDPQKRDKALALLDALGMADPEYRQGVSEGS